MSATPKTKSVRKLAAFTASQELDRLAIEIAKRRQIPVIEAYREAADSLDVEQKYQ